MKKFLFFLLLFTFFSVGTVFADGYVHIPDENLREFIAESLEKDPDMKIKREDFVEKYGGKDYTIIKQLETLFTLGTNELGEPFLMDANKMFLDLESFDRHTSRYRFMTKNAFHLTQNKIGDLTGIEHLKMFESLLIDGDGHSFSDLTPISKMENLRHLVILDSNITDLQQISNLKNLELLVIRNSNIESLDGIENFENLIELNLRNNRIQDMEKVTKLKKLRVLDLSKNIYIDEIPKSITELQDLEYLDLEDNKLQKVPKELRELKKLQYLDLSRNDIEGDLGFTDDLENLTYLDMSWNKLTDISALYKNVNLKHIDISENNAIRDTNANVKANDFQIFRSKELEGSDFKYTVPRYLKREIVEGLTEEDADLAKKPFLTPNHKVFINDEIREYNPERLQNILSTFISNNAYDREFEYMPVDIQQLLTAQEEANEVKENRSNSDREKSQKKEMKPKTETKKEEDESEKEFSKIDAEKETPEKVSPDSANYWIYIVPALIIIGGLGFVLRKR